MGASLGSLIWFTKVISSQLTVLLPGTAEQWHLDQDALRNAILTLVSQNTGMFLTFHILILIIWIYAIIDAYISARPSLRKEIRHDDEPHR